MAQTHTGDFYCVKCKGKVKTTGTVVVSEKSGRKSAKAVCPTCNTRLTLFLPKA
jgi:hypothetical protein